MEREQLKQRLSELHQELSGSEPVDPELKSLLQQIAGDIDSLVDRSDSSGGEGEVGEIPADVKQGLIDRMLDVTTEFEESHPNLTTIIGRIADALSRFGI